MIQSDYITLVIPTYGREGILIETIAMLLALKKRAGDVLIIDQTPVHETATEKALQGWQEEGLLRWIRLDRPSIPHAMNVGLLQARTPFVLFLDDDIIPDQMLVAAHAAILTDLAKENISCVAGQVLQPGEEEIDPDEWPHGWFPFHSNRRQFIQDVMAGNLCVDREKALRLGGFDENFVGSAFRFESEFARRVKRGGGRILFEPNASIRHLRAGRGGTRAYGDHLTTWKPHHAVGKYYFSFTGGWGEALTALLVQPLRAVRTRHHLRRPWWIPVSLTAELLAIGWAFLLYLKGPRYVAVEPEPGRLAPS